MDEMTIAFTGDNSRDLENRILLILAERFPGESSVDEMRNTASEVHQGVLNWLFKSKVKDQDK